MNGLALCAGIGGLELGLHIALPAHRTVCYVEREAYAAAALVARMADSTLDTAPVWDDLFTFDGEPWRGVVDIISAGDPCQPFSSAGRRQGEADERYLWPEVARVIREVSPQYVFLENVAGAVDARYGHKLELEGMGYRVEAGLFSAEEVGAPHQRARLFLLAEKPECIGRGGRDVFGDSQRLQREVQIARPCGSLANPTITGATDKPRPVDGRGRPPEVPQGDGAASAIHQGIHNGSRRDNLDGCDKGMADPAGSDRWKPDREDRPRRGLASRRPAPTDSLPLFPPGPADLGAWGRILAVRPEVEPAVRGMADGMAYRNDRLRLCGNGVVPATAALAFAALWGRLRAREG